MGSLKTENPKQTLYTGKYFSIHLDDQGTEFVHTRDEVLVVALDESEQAILLGEPSPAFGETALVLPGGTVEPGEDYVETGNRELQEELGLKAGQLDFLGELRPNAKYYASRSFVFLGRELIPSSLIGDENYHIQPQRVALDGFERMVETGQLKDARLIASLYLARTFLHKE